MDRSSVLFSSDKSGKDGLVGCPEMAREHLLSSKEFEKIIKKYHDYVDKANTWHRRPLPFAQVFHKFLPDVVRSLNALLARDEAVRKKFKLHLKPHSYRVSPEILRDMDLKIIVDLYREFVTAKTFLASELLTQLMDTPFQRSAAEGEDPFTITALVMQASTSFRERLESMGAQTIKKCTDQQIRDAFIKMMLGKDDRNLADFSACATWEDAVSAILELEGKGQGVTLLKLAQRLDKSKPATASKAPSKEDKDKEDDKGRSRKSDSKTESAKVDEDAEPDWEKTYHQLALQISHNQAEMKGHDSWRAKVKRLLHLRDSRHRDDQMREFARGGAYLSRSPHRNQGQAVSYRESEAQARGGRPANDAYHSRERERDSSRDRPDRRSDRQESTAYRSYDRQNDRASSTEREQGQSDRIRSTDSTQRVMNSRTSDPPSRSQLGAGPPPQSRARPCYNCGKEGHLASECPNPRKDGAARGRSSSREDR
jgi:hypothetical protein